MTLPLVQLLPTEESKAVWLVITRSSSTELVEDQQEGWATISSKLPKAEENTVNVFRKVLQLADLRDTLIKNLQDGKQLWLVIPNSEVNNLTVILLGTRENAASMNSLFSGYVGTHSHSLDEVRYYQLNCVPPQK